MPLAGAAGNVGVSNPLLLYWALVVAHHARLPAAASSAHVVRSARCLFRGIEHNAISMPPVEIESRCAVTESARPHSRPLCMHTDRFFARGRPPGAPSTESAR